MFHTRSTTSPTDTGSATAVASVCMCRKEDIYLQREREREREREDRQGPWGAAARVISKHQLRRGNGLRHWPAGRKRPCVLAVAR
jgi:hypothetical protein